MSQHPTETPQENFYKSSAKLYRQLYDEEARYIEAYIRKHPTKEYRKTASGFWIYRPQSHALDEKYARYGDEVHFIYSIQDFNGREIYPEDKFGPQKIRLGKESVIRGIEEALKIIREGEYCELLLPSFYAYGTSGDRDKISSNQPIVIQLKRLKNPKK